MVTVGVADAFKRAALNRPLFTKKKGVIIHIIVTQIIYNNIVAVIFRKILLLLPTLLNPSGLYTSV